MANISKINFKGVEYDIKPLMDAAPTQGSTNAVSSGGVYEALAKTQSDIDTVKNLQDTAIFTASPSGTKALRVNASIPAGNYIVTVDNVVSTDTSDIYCAVNFSVGATVKKGLLVRREAGEYTLELPEAVTSIIFNASSTYAAGDGDTFAFTNFAVKDRYPLKEAVTQIQQDIADINGDITDVQDSVDVVDGKCVDNLAEINSIKNMTVEDVFSDTVSGTKAVRVNADIPAGDYVMSIDNVVSTDTGSVYCAVNFSVGATVVTSILTTREAGKKYTVNLPQPVTSIVFNASSTYAMGDGDTFTFTGVKVSESYPLYDRVEEIRSTIDSIESNVNDFIGDFEDVIKSFIHGTYSGRKSVSFTGDYPAGKYIVQVDKITSADTDGSSCLFAFTTNNNVVITSVLLPRDTAVQKIINLTSAAKKVFAYAGVNNSQSIDDAFTYDNLQLLKINDILLGSEDNLIPVPDGFGWVDSPITGHLSQTQQGIQCNLDVGTYKPTTGKIYYVSPNGSDSNTGTDADHPLQSIRTALLKSDIDIVVLKDGFYDYSLLPQHINGLTRDIAVIADTNAVPVLGTCDGTQTFSKTEGYTNVYETSVYSNCVYDMQNHIPYAMVDSVAEVDATQGSFFADGTTTYIHTKDDSAPTHAIVKCCQTYDNFRITADNAYKIYLEGLTICGGDSGALRVTGAGQIRPKLYAKNCKFFGAVEWGACFLESTESVLQNCEAAWSESDGFGYHKTTNAPRTPRGIEINCEGHHNGKEEGTKNGSTMHIGGAIIRVNGRYHHNKGPNVGDVHNNTTSWNLACKAWRSAMSVQNLKNTDFVCSDNAPTMWLDSCSGYGSTQSLLVHGNGEAYVRNCAFASIYVGDDAHMETY